MFLDLVSWEWGVLGAFGCRTPPHTFDAMILAVGSIKALETEQPGWPDVCMEGLGLRV